MPRSIMRKVVQLSGIGDKVSAFACIQICPSLIFTPAELRGRCSQGFLLRKPQKIIEQKKIKAERNRTPRSKVYRI